MEGDLEVEAVVEVDGDEGEERVALWQRELVNEAEGQRETLELRENFTDTVIVEEEELERDVDLVTLGERVREVEGVSLLCEDDERETLVVTLSDLV
jgi:hypothetical protein